MNKIRNIAASSFSGAPIIGTVIKQILNNESGFDSLFHCGFERDNHQEELIKIPVLIIFGENIRLDRMRRRLTSVMVAGRAAVSFQDERVEHMKAGDYLIIPAHLKHSLHIQVRKRRVSGWRFFTEKEKEGGGMRRNPPLSLERGGFRKKLFN